MFAVKLPGRESRAKEPFFQNMQQIVDEVVGVLLPELKEKPFALFGHRWNTSMPPLTPQSILLLRFKLELFIFFLIAVEELSYNPYIFICY